jgi:hypothetical protein
MHSRTIPLSYRFLVRTGVYPTSRSLAVDAIEPSVPAGCPFPPIVRSRRMPVPAGCRRIIPELSSNLVKNTVFFDRIVRLLGNHPGCSRAIARFGDFGETPTHMSSLILSFHFGAAENACQNFFASESLYSQRRGKEPKRTSSPMQSLDSHAGATATA